MPDAPINPLTDRYVLEGRLVTMGPAGALPDGAIYIHEGEIKAVLPATQPAPPGFETAPRVRTGDTIYPGLIELHNHLSYNAMPLWDVPRKFTNNGQWRNHEDYRKLITKPSQVLGRSAGIVEALIRYVECRCLLGGVTTSQGITLANAGGIESYYKGIVRNVEQQTGDARFPPAETSIGNPETDGAAAYLEKLGKHTCYLQHLSEGIDDTARGWFLRLQMDNGGWAITDAFCGIHSTALTAGDFRIVHERGGSIVWSPLSNYLLYGQTTDIEAAKQAGILIALGSDWAPSGSKNLLGELKVAWLASQAHGDVFSAEEIVAMATRNPARILKWDKVLGTIEPGKRADLIAVNGQQGDEYLHLIEARESSITLVLIDGVPRVGQKRLMAPFGEGTETTEVGGASRVLNLADPDTHPLVAGLTLGEATQRLRQAMQELPQLAEDLDADTASGLFSGSADAAGLAWRIVTDFEPEESLDLAAEPLVAFVQPMELEAEISVAGDPAFLRRLNSAGNLPTFIKEGLPPLYGQSVPLPDSASFLRDSPSDRFPEQVIKTTRDLKSFAGAWRPLTLEERLAIVDQALLLLQQNYVHLPLKRAMYAVDPVQRLRLLRYRLEQAQPDELPPESSFHSEMTAIFSALRDLHTSYRLPAPYRNKTAWLPFLVEEFWEDGRRHFVISKIVGDAGPDSFEEGVELLYWNGTPIERAIALNAERQAGGNEAARHARGLNALTIRPLACCPPPDEEWVTVRYRGLDDQLYEWRQEWLIFEPGRSAYSISPNQLLGGASGQAELLTAIGVDDETDEIQEARRVLFAGRVVIEENRAAQAAHPFAIHNARGGIATYLPTIFRAMPVTTSHGTFGYIRIFTFNVSDAGAFVTEFARLARQLPTTGLIIDVRGNAGGLIHAAERLLQLLTPNPIEPETAQFINTPLNLQICRRHAGNGPIQGLNLSDWIASLEQAIETGATYSLGFPITDRAACNDTGQRYYGPVLLIVDALCYSATDIFAAGFQDHQIGPVLGTSTHTGAGGANVWSHRILQTLAPQPAAAPASYRPLPRGADLRVAVRRTVRVGQNAGGVLEDLGVRPDHFHQMTRHDLLAGNADLIERATSFLADMKSHSIQVQAESRHGAWPLLTITTSNVTRLDPSLNGRPQRSLDVRDNRATIDLDDVAGDVVGQSLLLELRAFDGERPVIVYRQEVLRNSS